MKQKFESIHFLRQLQKAKKLSLELAKRECQAMSLNQNPGNGNGKKSRSLEKDFAVCTPAKITPLKTQSPVRRRSFASSSRHSRSSRRFLVTSAATSNSKVRDRPKSKEPPTFVGLQKFVEVVVDGYHSQINVFDQLEVMTPDELVGFKGWEKEEAEKENTPKKSDSSPSKCNQKSREVLVAASSAQLHQPCYRVLENHVPPFVDVPRSDGYYRFIEKTAEELEEEVEYEMDYEDLVWLRLYNEHRRKTRQQQLSDEAFEMLIDRLEKEAYSAAQVQRIISTDPPPEDDDVMCAICLDDDCQNTNVILFCDRCNLAVHQECYGVPYVPEGQWLCSRCQVAPARPVSCVLCPVKDGAMKQTNRGEWSHILCALWIPEVGFGSIESLEPITKIEKVPPARRRLTCSVCKQKGIGACIQCMRKNCVTAFHVTCAQQAGIFMTIEPTHNEDGTLSNVRKTLLCNRHKPANARPFQPMYDSSGMETDEDRPLVKLRSEDSRSVHGRGSAQRLPPSIDQKLAPVEEGLALIPKQRLLAIAESLKMKDRASTLDAVLSYWQLKREERNGIPLLRRLQAASLIQAMGIAGDDDSGSLAGLKDLKKLRHEMEKIRLLLELIRKREKLKLEQIKLHQKSFRLELEPFNELLRKTLDQLQAKDRSSIFAFPVPLKELPDYASKIKHPMDFSTMRSKIDRHAYRRFDDFVGDFDLIINNCTVYNAKHTLYHKAALRLRQQAEEILVDAKEAFDGAGFCSSSGLYSSAAEAQNKNHERRRHSSMTVPLEDRRSSDRVKTATRRYLIDDEVTPAVTSSCRKRKPSTDSEEPPVLSRCPSPVDGTCPSLPPRARKRSRLSSSHKDPPLLVKSNLCSPSPATVADSKPDDSRNSSCVIASKDLDLLTSFQEQRSNDSSANDAVPRSEDFDEKKATVPASVSQGSCSEVLSSNPMDVKNDGDCENLENTEPTNRTSAGLLDVASDAMESDGSNSLPGNPSSSENYLKSLECLKADSAYNSASCSSSDLDNCDKR